MPREPIPRQFGDLVESSGFLEQMGGSRHDLQLVLALHRARRLPVHPDDGLITFPDNQERRGADRGEMAVRQIGTPPARNHRCHIVRMPRLEFP